jgi:hypothetical protein
MTLVDLVTLIGEIITELDSTLADPDLPMSDPKWQILFAMRKHLDDLQRELVQTSIATEDAAYAGLTTQITAASKDLQSVIDDFTKLDTVINDVSKIASLLDQVMKLVP